MVLITVKVEGMVCGMCEAHLNDALRAALPVKKVSSSHIRGEAKILCESDLSEEEIRKAVAPTGYAVRSVTKESYAPRFSLFRRGSGRCR